MPSIIFSIHGDTGVAVKKSESLGEKIENLINLNTLEKASPPSFSSSYSELAQNFDFEAISRGVTKNISTHAEKK